MDIQFVRGEIHNIIDTYRGRGRVKQNVTVSTIMGHESVYFGVKLEIKLKGTSLLLFSLRKKRYG